MCQFDDQAKIDFDWLQPMPRIEIGRIWNEWLQKWLFSEIWFVWVIWSYILRFNNVLNLSIEKPITSCNLIIDTDNDILFLALSYWRKNSTFKPSDEFQSNTGINIFLFVMNETVDKENDQLASHNTCQCSSD